MAPPNKKILLQYLWADEAVMRDDYAKKISKGMTDFANEFYGRFGFELDVVPAPDGKMPAKASKYALQKNDGIQPDVAAVPKIALEYDEKIEAFQPQIDALKKERVDLDAKIAALQPGDDATAVYKRNSDNWDALIKVYERQTELGIEMQGAAALANGDTALRMGMTLRFLSDEVGDGRRLNVVFCRFVPAPRAAVRTLAETRDQIPVTFIGPFFMWPYTYIVVDIGKSSQPSAVAHEIVHAAGHVHPPVQLLFKDLKKNRNLFSAPTSLSDVLEKVATFTNVLNFFEPVPGAYADGPNTDLMNYNSQGLKPSQLTLSDADKKLLDAASFVSP